MEKITIILTTYNRVILLERAIKSVLNQTCDEFKLLIVDDGSTDKTNEMVKKYLKNPRIKYIYKKNGGQSSARNLGIKIAESDYVMFLDDDDELCEKAVEMALRKIEETNAPWIYCNQYLSIRENKEIIIHRGNGLKENIYEYLLTGNLLGAGEIFFRKYLEKIGGFNEKLKIYEDKEMRLRLAKIINKVEYIDGYIYKYYENLNSVSNSNKNKKKRKIKFYEAQLTMYRENKQYIDNHENTYKYWMKMLRRINLETRRYKTAVYYCKECLKIEKSLRNYRKYIYSILLGILFENKNILKENY